MFHKAVSIKPVTLNPILSGSVLGRSASQSFTVAALANRSRVKKRQQGFLIPLSLFIIIAASSLAVAMSQMASGSRSSAILSTLNSQAYYAADGGIQSALSRMYYSGTSRSAVDANCTSVNGSSISFTGVGLSGCSADLTCQVVVSSDGSVSLYRITSESACGSGDYTTGRRMLTETYMRNQ